MAKSGNAANSSGKGEPAFCGVLRRAIKAEFGSSKAFAKHVGISESRTSQILSGLETTTAPTLEYLLAAFPSVAIQSQIQEAWIRTYAPSPVERLAPSETDESAVQLLDALPALMNQGRARAALKAVEALESTAIDQELFFRLAQAATKLALFLDRPYQARKWSGKLLAKAKEHQELSWVARGLYLDATVARSVETSRAADLARSFTAFESFLQSWTPRSPEGNRVYIDLSQALLRDFGLTVLELFKRKRLDTAHLSSALGQIDAILAENSISRPEILIDVSGRLHLALGNLSAAEDRYEELMGLGTSTEAEQVIKGAILHSNLLRVKGNPGRGAEQLITALDQSYDLDDLHHARVIEQTLSLLHSSKGR